MPQQPEDDVGPALFRRPYLLCFGGRLELNLKPKIEGTASCVSVQRNPSTP